MTDTSQASFGPSHLLPFFDTRNVQDIDLRNTLEPFDDLAARICRELPPTDERHHTIARLLEARDWAVRAHRFKATT